VPVAAHVALLGRRRERGALDRLVADVRTGSSRALVLRGQAGVGKTALLDHVAQHASGCAVARAAGVESEMELAFAALQQLCAPFLARLEDLPGPQGEALSTAFGLRAGAAPDRFLVGLAVLSLLSHAAEERPLVCIVDDAHWLDAASAQTFAFVARRLGAESVGLVIAVREPAAARHLDGLPELVIGGLEDEDARKLLETVVAGPLDHRLRDRLVAETRGNPLALLELPRGRSPAELAGGFGLADGPDSPDPPAQIEERFREQMAGLPPATRLLLLVAAADPVGDPLLVRRAAADLDIDPGAEAPATEAGLVELGAQVRFRHPLVRSAVYRAAAPEERRRVHAALAEATDAQTDPDRRAWHRAQATSGLDEAVAAELERSADRARARGGLAAGAAFHERAAGLTPDPRRRADRALVAAQGKHQAGAPDAALRLLAAAQAGPLDELRSARAQLLRAQITFATTRGRDAPPLLLAAAKRLEPLDATLARETYLDAFAAALSAERLVSGGDTREVAAAVLAAGWAPSSRPCDLLLDALAVLTTEGYAAGAPVLKAALAAFREARLAEDEELRWLWLACHVARVLCDDEAWDELTARQVDLARRAGAFALLPVALEHRFTVELFAGRLAVALSAAAEAQAVVEATGSHLSLTTDIGLANWRGDEAAARALIEAHRQDVLRRGEGLWLKDIEWGTAVCYLGHGRYDEALAAAERAAEDPHGMELRPQVLADLIEAATRCGQPERGTAWLHRLAEIAEANASQFALGLLARSRAMLDDGQTAEPLYREAIERLGRTRIRAALPRAQLVYGEWLRRENRRVDAREQLRAAYEILSDMGRDAFAERARRELVATGETVRKRTVDTRDELTAQETQIARRAADGATNAEIGAELFLSPRTVEWHLRKVFGKLGINSRKELRPALSDAGAAPFPV
jgi:DNA-binding CsgD family transcriptional regulator